MNDGAASLVSVREVHKSYGKQHVLRGVNLDLAAGEVTLLVGANGAGKSTLLRILVALARPDKGSVAYANCKNAPLHEIGFTSHSPLLYGALTVRENISLLRAVRGASEDVAAALGEWDLISHAEKPVAELSKGMQARTALCRAFLGNPRYLFLDEPSSSLDDAGVKLLRTKIANASADAGGKACVVVATHDLARLSATATRVVVLQEGNIRYDSRPGGGAAQREHVLASFLEINR